MQATLKVGEENTITALENKRRLRKEKVNTANLVVANTVTNGLDPQSFVFEGSLLLILFLTSFYLSFINYDLDNALILVCVLKSIFVRNYFCTNMTTKLNTSFNIKMINLCYFLYFVSFSFHLSFKAFRLYLTVNDFNKKNPNVEYP